MAVLLLAPILQHGSPVIDASDPELGDGNEEGDVAFDQSSSGDQPSALQYWHFWDIVFYRLLEF